MKKHVILLAFAWIIILLTSCAKGNDEVYPRVALSGYVEVNALTWYGFHHQTITSDDYIDYGGPNAPVVHPDKATIDNFAVEVTANVYAYRKLYVTKAEYAKVNN